MAAFPTAIHAIAEVGLALGSNFEVVKTGASSRFR
jgi:hypothetical protein